MVFEEADGASTMDVMTTIIYACTNINMISELCKENEIILTNNFNQKNLWVIHIKNRAYID